MAYELIEVSNDFGRPIFLYEFEIGDKVYRYTPSTEAVSANGDMFSPVYIQDEGINQTGEVQTDAVSITIDADTEVAELFKSTPPINQIVVRRMVRHEFDPEVAINYVGFVTQANFGTMGVAVLDCATLSPTMQRSGLRLYWTRGCPYSLYDQSTCRVRKEDYGVMLTVDKASFGVITSSGAAYYENGWFTGGFIEWTDERTGALESRSIDEHSGQSLRLLGHSDGIPLNSQIKAYPGCPKNIEYCKSRFSNESNYGGYPHLPGTSPFNGDPLY